MDSLALSSGSSGTRECFRPRWSGQRGVWVAELDGDVVGYGRAARFAPEEGAPPEIAPAGWYLTGIVVAPEQRRLGIGEALTVARLRWLGERTEVVRYFTSSVNLASIALHSRMGFVEVTRRFSFPGVTFDGGEGVLFERRPGGR